jgi:hypothetical protein
MYVLPNTEARLRIILAVESNDYYIFVCARACVRACVCVPGRVSVCMRVRACSLATRMRHVVTLFMAPLAPPHFSTLSNKRHNFRKIIVKHKMCVLIFSTTFVKTISHSNKNLARYCHECENVFV